MTQKNIIAYVMSVPAGAIESIRAYEKAEDKTFRIMLITDSRSSKRNSDRVDDETDLVVPLDFSRPHKVAEALQPYQHELLAITCRSDMHISKFKEVIPHVPYLRTPTTESIEWATDKYDMRRRFELNCGAHNPKFTLIKDNSKKERARIAEKVGFPLIVKPTNLAQSMLVTICYHEEELEKALRSAFRKIRRVYGENGRSQLPKLMAEEYMEGDMYSVDGYVNSRGEVYFCPLVRVKTGMNIGHQDFYNYMHLTPTALKKPTVRQAESVAERGVHALGLKNTSVHVELMKIDDEWKLIEIGARVGGFRHKLHMLSCDIDHSLNDVLIRLPKRPRIPKKCQGYAATLKWYPEREGKITKLKGIKKIQELASFVEMKVNKKVGDRCYFAKNGGTAVFTVTLTNKERSQLLADIRRIEQHVDIQVT